MNYLLRNAGGMFYSKAGSSNYWVHNENQAAVYGQYDDAAIDKRDILNDKINFKDNAHMDDLSDIYIEETDLPVTP